MEDGIFLWSNLMIQLPLFNFVKKKLTMRLDPSLGVNRMSTKRNDYAPKNECVDLFFNICPK